jgi:hypothetical protein
MFIAAQARKKRRAARAFFLLYAESVLRRFDMRRSDATCEMPVREAGARKARA